MGVGGAQVAQADLRLVGLGLKERLLEVQGGVQQATRHRRPVQFGEALALGEQPLQQIIGGG